jgi:ribosomal protein L12E/L44/L45/RPP1/RPP2
MKYLIIIYLLLGSYSLHAQHYSSDPDLNKSLITLDANAQLDFGAFRTDISLGYNISEKKIDYLAAEVGMSAGDIYLTAEIASLTHKSVDEVVAVYTVHKDKGWGAMAKELGIKPGSPEFHALKNNAKNKGKNNGKGNGKSKGKK